MKQNERMLKMKNRMMIMIALLLSAALLAGCGGAAKNETPAPQETPQEAPQETSQEAPQENASEAGPVVGGWAVPESFEITDEQRAAFEKATADLIGADYELIACLGRQVVAGTNYALLCSGRAVAPDAAPFFSVAYIYADLQGGAKLLGFRGLTPNGEFVQDPLAPMGGWQVPADEADGLAAFEKAMEGLTGVNYVPIRVIGEQVVSGMNYCVLTQSTVVYPGAAPTYSLVFVYKDLNGNVSMTDVTELTVPGAPEEIG